MTVLQRLPYHAGPMISPADRRLAALAVLLLVLALGACEGMDVSYDYTDLDERNKYRNEPD